MLNEAPALSVRFRDRTPARFTRRILLAIIVSLQAQTALLADRWYEHYERAEEALKAQEWNLAATQILEAIQQRPEPGASVRTYGMKFLKYHPYFNLGIAYFNMGRYEEAVQAFETEERFGAISESPADNSNMKTFKELAGQRIRGAQQAADLERIRGIVAGSLAEARLLEQRGDPDGAIMALGAGLALQPANAELGTALERLRSQVAERERRRLDAERIGAASREGREFMAARDWTAASAAFRTALALDPDLVDERQLLEESQERLRQSLEQERSEKERADLIRHGMESAGKMESSGDLNGAIRELQSVLALRPEHAEALTAQQRLLKLREAEEARQIRERETGGFLALGVEHLNAGEFKEAIELFNKVLAVDALNQAARTYLSQAFAGMHQVLLTPGKEGGRPTLPPVIVLAWRNDKTSPGEEGDAPLEPQRSDRAEILVEGVIVDDSPDLEVTLSVTTPGRPEPVSRRPLSVRGEPAGSFYRYSLFETMPLPAGISTIRVVASDSDGLTAEALHSVLYTLPPWKRPEFWAISLLSAGTVVGAGLAVRATRRRRLRRRLFNPYVAGAPVLNEDLFMGRETLIARILQTIHNNSILLFGERRIGKTSLQHHLKKRLEELEDPEYEFFPVYIDLQGTPQEKFFSTVGHEIRLQVGARIFSDSAAASRSMPDDYDYEDLVTDVRRALRELKATRSRRAKLVLLIDEVDELNNYDPRINQRLRSLFMKSFAEDLVAVVSGVGIKKRWESEGSPWYNFFEEIEVKPFTRQDAIELIQKPIRGIFTLEDGVPDQIISLTDCKPYLIQKLCVSLVGRLHEEGRRRITVADVAAVGRPREI